MTDIGTSTRSELPSVRQLNKATSFAAATAAILLVTTVLPAEYGIDPTGVGSVLGLTAMGDGKQAEQQAESTTPAGQTALSQTDPVGGETTAAIQKGEIMLTLQPGEGREVKATMKTGEEFDFSWSTANGSKVNYDQHGEVFGAAADEYTSYDKGTKASSTGKFRAPFDGTHGWYWRNRTEGPVTIIVSANGQFSKFELK